MIGQRRLFELVSSPPARRTSALYVCRASFIVFRGALEYAVRTNG